jgi:hypothetical protein
VLIIPLTSRGQANGRLTFRFTEERDGFGKLVKHKRKVRPGINPSTKQKIKIHAKTVLQFRVAKAAKGPVPPISASTPTRQDRFMLGADEKLVFATRHQRYHPIRSREPGDI